MTSAPMPPEQPTRANGPAEARFARLAAGVAGLGRQRGIDTERVLLIAGSISVPLGILFIVLGWAGAAHTSRLFEQIPYLISGGILGGALVVAGGFLYFGYWLTRLVYEGRAQSRQMAELLTRIDARLESLEEPMMTSVLLGSPETRAVRRRARPNGVTDRAAGSGRSDLVATAAGTMLHRADCVVVTNKDGLRAVAADTPGLRPCRICQPLEEQRS